MEDYKVLAFMLQNPENYSYYRIHLQQIKFQDVWVKYAFDLCEMMYTQLGDIPHDSTQLKYIVRTRSPLADKPEQLNFFKSVIDKLYDPTIISGVDRIMMADHLFLAEREGISKQILSFNHIPTQEELAGLQNKLHLLSDVAYGESDDWALPLSEEELMRSPEDLDEERGDPLTTGCPRWDESLDGGFFRKEQVLFVALPGFGKSLLLLHMGITTAITGNRSILYSMDNPMWEVKKKIRAHISGIPVGTKITNDEWQRIIEPYLGKFKPDSLIIRNWPRGGKSMIDVRRDVKKAAARYGKIDQFILDYLNVMAPMTAVKGQPWVEIDQNSMMASGLAEEMDMSCIAAAQSDKSAMQRITQDMDNTAGAFSLNRHTALTITVNQKGSDMASNRVWLALAKGRRTRTRYKAPFHMDRQTFKLTELDQEYQLIDEDGETRAQIKTRKKKTDVEEAISEAVLPKFLLRKEAMMKG